MRRPSPRFDVSLDIQVLLILMAGFGFLAFLSLLAISGWVPWMREQVTFFDAASEANLWTWANVAVLVSGADAHFVIACRTGNRDRRSALGWLVSAGLLALLSLDDLASIHERLEGIGRHFGGGIGVLHFAWIVPGALVAIVTAGLFMTLILRLARPAPILPFVRRHDFLPHGHRLSSA